MQKCANLIIMLALIGLHSYFDTATSKELNSENYSSYEYRQIFQNLPELLESFLKAADERPYILENNDVTVFEKTIKEGTIIGEHDKRSIELDQEDGYDENKKEKVQKHYTIVDVNPNNTDLEEVKKAHEFQVDNEIKSKEELDLPKHKLNRQKHTANDKVSSDTNQSNNEVDWSKAYASSFQNLLSVDISQEDIEQGSIMAERLLEDYNYNRIKKN